MQTPPQALVTEWLHESSQDTSTGAPVPSTPSDDAPKEGRVSLETLVSTRVPVSLQV